MKGKWSLSNKSKSLASFLIMCAIATVISACVPGVRLKTVPAGNGELEGSFTLFLYGCSNPQRIDNAVIIAPEGGKHPIEIYGPAFEYKVKTGVPAAEALTQADRFLRCSVYYKKTELRNILDPSGTVIGHELRPLYSPLDFGRDDVLTITYTLTEKGSVMTFIQLDRDIDLKINDDGNDRMHDRNGGSFR